MQMYLTSVVDKTDMKAVLLQVALDILHQQGRKDMITGLRSRTNAGRPNWDKVRTIALLYRVSWLMGGKSFE